MANNNLSIGQPFGITIWHGEYLRNHMANHPDLRLHQLQSHGFADHEAVLIRTVRGSVVERTGSSERILAATGAPRTIGTNTFEFRQFSFVDTERACIPTLPSLSILPLTEADRTPE
jgi:hypothetical protein